MHINFQEITGLLWPTSLQVLIVFDVISRRLLDHQFYLSVCQILYIIILTSSMLFCKDSFLKAEVTPWYLQAMWENQQDQYQPARDELAAISPSQGSYSAVFSQSQIAILNIHMPPASTVTPKVHLPSPPKALLWYGSPRKSSSHQSPCKFLGANWAADILHVASDMKNQLPQSLEAFQSLTRELTAKVMQGWRLSNLISKLASFPGSLSLITDFKFPVSAEWEEGCQWVFLALEKTRSRLEKMH